MISLAADLIEMSMSHVPCYVSIYVRRCFVEWMRPLLCVVEVRFLYLGVAGVTITANRLPCCCLLYKLVCFGLCIGWMVRERFLGGLCNISVQVFLVHTHVSEGVRAILYLRRGEFWREPLCILNCRTQKNTCPRFQRTKNKNLLF